MSEDRVGLTWTQIVEQNESYNDHLARVKKIKKGSSVTFTDAQSGKQVKGVYHGLKRMGARSYAHVEHPGGATRVPVHQVHAAD